MRCGRSAQRAVRRKRCIPWCTRRGIRASRSVMCPAAGPGTVHAHSDASGATRLLCRDVHSSAGFTAAWHRRLQHAALLSQGDKAVTIEPSPCGIL
jgi:hypothetical protein